MEVECSRRGSQAGNGAGLKILSSVVRGFKSHSLHIFFAISNALVTYTLTNNTFVSILIFFFMSEAYIIGEIYGYKDCLEETK